MTTASKKLTFRCIAPGLWISNGPNGGGAIRISDDKLLNKFNKSFGPEDRWAVHFKDWMGTAMVRRFPTLNAAKRFCQEN